MTLIELVTVVSVVAILAAIAMPDLSNVLASQRLRAAGTDLVSSLLVARSEAIKRNAQVQIAPQTSGDWTSGWKVTTVAGAEQVDKKGELGTRVKVTAPATIIYDGNGRLTVAGTSKVQFSDTDAKPGVQSRCVAIDSSGLPRLTIGNCT